MYITVHDCNNYAAVICHVKKSKIQIYKCIMLINKFKNHNT